MKPKPAGGYNRNSRGAGVEANDPPGAPAEWEATRVVKKIKPQQAGARKLSRQYGDALVCVRYRHDAEGQRRYTTVEVVIESTPVQKRTTPDVIIELKLNPFDQPLRSIVQASGGEWDGEARVWKLKKKIAEQLGLLDRMVVK